MQGSRSVGLNVHLATPTIANMIDNTHRRQYMYVLFLALLVLVFIMMALGDTDGQWTVAAWSHHGIMIATRLSREARSTMSLDDP